MNEEVTGRKRNGMQECRAGEGELRLFYIPGVELNSEEPPLAVEKTKT